MQLQLLCRMSITGGTWAEHGSEGQEETGLGQEAQGKQLEGSLHSYAILCLAAHLRDVPSCPRLQILNIN